MFSWLKRKNWCWLIGHKRVEHRPTEQEYLDWINGDINLDYPYYITCEYCERRLIG